MSTTIRNRLEVLLGNKLLVPGAEPTTAFTSPTLAANFQPNASVVDLADALAAIPNATLERQLNPKRFFFVLPSGPPPQFSDTTAIPDWYQILRDISEPISPELKSITEASNELPQTLPTTGRVFPKSSISVGEICDSFTLEGLLR